MSICSVAGDGSVTIAQDTALVSLKVLLVEDEEQWAEAFADEIQYALAGIVSVSTTIASSVEDAQQIVDREKFDVILTDVWFGISRRRGDGWMLEIEGVAEHRAIVTGDVSRIEHDRELLEARIPVLEKSLRDEGRITDLLVRIAYSKRLRTALSELTETLPTSRAYVAEGANNREYYQVDRNVRELFIEWVERVVHSAELAGGIHIGARRYSMTEILEDARSGAKDGPADQLLPGFAADLRELLSLDAPSQGERR